MKFLKDMRIVIVGGFISLIITIIDLMIQERKYAFDVHSLKYLSPVGWVFFILFLLAFTWFLVSIAMAIFRQITK